MTRHLRASLSVAVTLALAVLVGACDESPTTGPEQSFDPSEHHALLATSDVVLHAEADAFEPGAAVTLVLENRSGDTIGYNLCFHGLERRGSAGWAPADGEGRVCTAVLHLLEDGQSATYPTSLPETLAGGEYRFRTSVHFVESGQARDQVSEPFVIGG